jgi:FKBP-type peptidyl-prolyl cis-trans isomerase
LQRGQAEVDLPALMQGLSDLLSERELLMDEEEMAQVLREFATRMQQAAAERQAELAETNRVEGEAFLAENKAREGVMTTATGLQYEVLTQGEGNMPSETDEVTVNYRGTLLDGTEFDSTDRGGQPATFAVNGVIPGWTEVLQLMNVGSKFRVVVPPDLAYGARGNGQTIGPNATLVFEIELLEIAQ